MRINRAGDFELAFNSMIRMYMRNYGENYLKLISEVAEIYLKYFSLCTIVCALRDFVDGVRWNGDIAIPSTQVKKVDDIIKILVQQGLTLHKLNSEIMNESDRIIQFGKDIYFCEYWAGNSKYNHESFLQWVHENKLNEPSEYKTNNGKSNLSLPLKKRNLHLLTGACEVMLEYSYGRHTYMPAACVGLIKDNWDSMSDEFLESIMEFLKDKKSHNPDTNFFIEKMDDETWIIFKEDISMELISRDSYQRIKDAGIIEVKSRISKLGNTQIINTQRNCRKVIAELDGIKRRIDMIELGEKKSLISDYENVRNELISRLHYLWKIEDGHLYEEISKGVYIRKRSEIVY